LGQDNECIALSSNIKMQPGKIKNEEKGLDSERYGRFNIT